MVYQIHESKVASNIANYLENNPDVFLAASRSKPAKLAHVDEGFVVEDIDTIIGSVQSVENGEDFNQFIDSVLYGINIDVTADPNSAKITRARYVEDVPKFWYMPSLTIFEALGMYLHTSTSTYTITADDARKFFEKLPKGEKSFDVSEETKRPLVRRNNLYFFQSKEVAIAAKNGEFDYKNDFMRACNVSRYIAMFKGK